MQTEPANQWISSIAARTAVVLSFAILLSEASAQPEGHGSLVEDRAAKKLREAGDARYESDELKQAVEVWQSVIERYPRSRVCFEAHMRLGNYFLERERAYDRARVQSDSVVTDENPDERQRAEATLKMGICFYEARNFGKSFPVMRDVIEKFPVSGQVNQAYCYIGLGHFQLGHYRRAINALEKVGTALSEEEGKVEKVEAGKCLFVKIDDADLAVLGKPVNIEISDPDLDVSDSGDMLSAVVEIFRAKTDEELEAETLATVSNAEGATTEAEQGEQTIDRLKQIDQFTNQLRGEARYGMAGCYDLMVDEAQANNRSTTELRDRAFQEYKKVPDNFAESGRARFAEVNDYG